jgi:hypothetical protein
MKSQEDFISMDSYYEYLRTYYASIALNGFLKDYNYPFNDICKYSFDLADGMVNELKKRTNEHL